MHSHLDSYTPIAATFFLSCTESDIIVNYELFRLARLERAGNSTYIRVTEVCDREQLLFFYIRIMVFLGKDALCFDRRESME
jgi:hypothetical protein